MNEIEFKKYIKSNFPRTSTFISGLALFIVDLLVIVFCIAFGFFLVNCFASRNINAKSFINYSIFLPFFVLIYSINGLYPGMMLPPEDEVRRYSISNFFGFGLIIMTIIFDDLTSGLKLEFIIKNSKETEIIWAFIVAWITSLVVLPISREAAKFFFSKFRWWGVPAVVYCSGQSADLIIERLKRNKDLGYHPAVIIDSFEPNQTIKDDIPVFSPAHTEITDAIHKMNIKTAILCDYRGDFTPIMSSYRYTISVSRSQTSFTSTQQLKDIAGIIGFASTHNLTFKKNIFFKRFFDVSLILLFSPILLPVFILIGLLVKLTSKGPIFYGHERVGKNGKSFKCWKFRTMNINSQQMLEEILATDPVRRAEWEKDCKFVDDPRVTKFGKILRKTSLDELPQLINILVGDMSFIGPRPVTEPELVKYGKYRNYILSVYPGLSGMWQISGRSDTSYEERITFDTYYIQNWSLWLDLWIFMKTIWVVIKGKGAY